MILYIKAFAFPVIIGIVIFYLMYKLGRDKPNELRELFNKILPKWNGKITGGKYFGYPQYRFTYSGVNVAVMVTSYPLFSSEEVLWTIKDYHTYAIVYLKEPSQDFVSIISEKSSIFGRVSDYFKKQTVKSIHDNVFLSERISIYGNNNVFINNLLTDELKQKIININRKFDFFELRLQNEILFCVIKGIPESPEDIEILLNTALRTYDKYRELHKEDIVNYASEQIVEAEAKHKSIAIYLLAILYIFLGLKITLFFGQFSFNSFSKNFLLTGCISLFLAILAFAILIGGSGLLFFKKWGKTTVIICFPFLFILLSIISNYLHAGLIKGFPDILSSAKMKIILLLFFAIYFVSFSYFKKPEIKRMFK